MDGTQYISKCNNNLLPSIFTSFMHTQAPHEDHE